MGRRMGGMGGMGGHGTHGRRGGMVAVAWRRWIAPETQVTPHDKKISCLVTAQKKGASRTSVPDAPMGGGGLG